MIDEHQLLRDAGKAAQAQALLDNALFNEGHQKLEADLINGWINSEPRDTDFRERLWNMVHANRKHKDFFGSVVRDGQLAAVQLTALAAKR